MALLGLSAAPAFGAAVLQCVPYARIVSGVEIQGDALTWWDKAESRYRRGQTPKKGAVLAFRPHGPMLLGHVAVVSKVLDDRRILIRHANWSVPGAIEEDVLTIDVSEKGDWSAVRVWFSPNDQMGARTNPTFGFIYPAKAKLHKFKPDPMLGSSTSFARIDDDRWDEKQLPVLMRTTNAPPRGVLAPKPASVPGVAAAKATHAVASRGAPGAIARQPRRQAEFLVEYADQSGSAEPRTLGDIIADVKRDAALR